MSSDNTRKLYRIVRQRRYDGGRGADILQNQTVLYCGYDRDEAIRVYHQERGNDVKSYRGPGNYYNVVKATSKMVNVGPAARKGGAS
jgi:hypothetical protein